MGSKVAYRPSPNYGTDDAVVAYEHRKIAYRQTTTFGCGFNRSTQHIG